MVWIYKMIGTLRLAGLAALALTGLVATASAEQRSLRGHGGPVRSIAVASDGLHALTGSFDYSVMFWETAGGAATQVKRFTGHDAAVGVVRFVPRSWFALSGGDDGALIMWNLHKLEMARKVVAHRAKIADIAVSRDGRLVASASWDKTARIWSAADLSPRQVLKGHGGGVNAVAFSRDGSELFTGSQDGKVRAWRVSDGALLRIVYDHGWGISLIRALPRDGTLLVGSSDGDALVIDGHSGKLLRRLASHPRPLLSADFSARHNLLVTGSGDGKIRVWSMGDWRSLGVFDNPYGPVWALAIDAEGRGVYYGGLDDDALYWQMKPRKPFETVAVRRLRKPRLAADASPGERQFVRKCSICHTLDPNDGNRAGPTLHRLFGRRAGTLPGYAYSEALKRSDIIWNEQTIARLFDEGPAQVLPGTKMPMQRMQNSAERSALITYLKRATVAGAGNARP